MKYSQLIGIIAAMAVMVSCYFPWSFIESRDIVVTGMSAAGTHFGKPGLMNIIVSGIAVILFLVPRIWAKRSNIFFGIFNLGWSIRNYIIVSGCMMGECPVKKPALYLLVVFSVLMMLMTFLPKLEVKPRGKA